MKRKITIGAVSLILLVVFAYFSLGLLVESERFQEWMQTEVAQRTGYELKIGNLSLRPWLQLVATEINISKPGKLLLQVDKASLTINPIDLFSKRITRLSLERPVVGILTKDLFRTSEKPSTGVVIPSIRFLEVQDGEVVLGAVEEDKLAIRSISLKMKDFNLGQKTGIRFQAYLPWIDGDADLTFRGSPEQRGQTEIDLLIRQRPKNALQQSLSHSDETSGVLKAAFNFKRQGRENKVQVNATGAFNQFRLGSEEITGNFKSTADLNADFNEGEVSLQWDMPKLPRKIGRVEISMPPAPTTLIVGGRYSAAEKIFALKEMKLVSPVGSADGKGAISWKDNPMTLMETKVRIRKVPLGLLKSVVPKAFKKFAFIGNAAADLKLSGPLNSLKIWGLVHSDKVKVEGEGFALSRLSFRVPFEFEKSSFQAKAGRIQGKGLSFKHKEKGQFQLGTISLHGDIEKIGNKQLKTAGQFQVIKGSFSTPDGSKIGENLKANGQWDLSHGLQDSRTHFKGKLNVEGLELLWNKFFGDFQRERPAIEVEGDYLANQGELNLQKVNIAFRSIGDVEIQGLVSQPFEKANFNLTLRTENLRPGGLYDFFIRETFKLNYPFLDQLSLGGKTGFDVRTQGTLDKLDVEGFVRLTRGKIRGSDKWQIGSLEMTLPFSLSYPHSAADEKVTISRTGNLTIQEVKLGSTTMPPIEATFTFRNNSVKFLHPIHIPIYGGSVTIKDLAWRDIVEAPKNISFSLEVEEIHLQEFTKALDWYRFGGTISGSIPQIQWADGTVRSRGEIKVAVFGGQLIVKEMEVANAFSSLPSIKLDARLEEINLEQASETFKFGRLSGILQGAVEDLVITHGQPAEFRAKLESIPRDGVGQWISVEALKEITILSSGSEAGSLYGGLAGFFDYFRYKKLGFKATLKNDRLTLRGIETKEGHEYLVVGSFLPPRVNVISHSQEIGFSELMRRFKQVRGGKKEEQRGK